MRENHIYGWKDVARGFPFGTRRCSDRLIEYIYYGV